MPYKVRLETKKVEWGKYPITTLCHMNELPTCHRCHKILSNNNFAILCDNDVFFCENCIDIHEHRKTYDEKYEHNDKLVYIIINV